MRDYTCGSFAAGLGEMVDNIYLADTCAGCHITRNLRNCCMTVKSSNYAVSLIGGADIAAGLDAKRAIDQGSRLAAEL